jgi:hypothetical protein
MAGIWGYIEDGQPLGWMVIWPIALIIIAATQSVNIVARAICG